MNLTTASIQVHGDTIYRVKGILHMQGEARRVVVHGVHRELQGGFGPSWKKGGEKQSVLVLIGLQLKSQQRNLKMGFRSCVHAKEPNHDKNE